MQTATRLYPFPLRQNNKHSAVFLSSHETCSGFFAGVIIMLKEMPSQIKINFKFLITAGALVAA